jgi:hypothetical protein
MPEVALSNTTPRQLTRAIRKAETPCKAAFCRDFYLSSIAQAAARLLPDHAFRV